MKYLKKNNLINKYKNIALPVKASMAYMIGNILQQSINLITIPIFTRILSETEYGIVSVYYSWLSILSIIITLSLSAGIYNNAMIDFEEDIDAFTSCALFLTTLTTLIAYVIYFKFKSQIINITGIDYKLMNLMFISILLSPAMSFWLAKERFNYKYKLSLAISIFVSIGGAIISYLLVYNNDINKAYYKIFGVASITISISLILYFYIILKGKKVINLKYWKYLIMFGVPLIPHYLSNIILAQSDRIIISNMVGNVEAGLYGLAYSIGSVIGIVWAAINASLIPWTLKMMKEKKYKLIEKIATPLVLFAGVVSLIFIAIAPELIKVLAAPSYYQAVWVIPPVILAIFLSFINSLFGNIEFFHKKSGFIMMSSLSAAGINIILNIIFIPKYGYIAAAYTTMIGYLVLAIVNYIFMCVIEKNKIYNIKFIIIFTLSIITMSYVIVQLYNYVLIRYSIILISIILMIINRSKIFTIIKLLKNKNEKIDTKI